MRGRRCTGDDGAGLVEYALIVSLILAVCVTAIAWFGSESGVSVRSSCQHITTQACE